MWSRFMEAPESLHLISLIPLPWSLFNQTRMSVVGRIMALKGTQS